MLVVTIDPRIGAAREVRSKLTPPPATVTITVRRPPEVRVLVQRPPLPEVDLSGDSPEVRLAWQALCTAERDQRQAPLDAEPRALAEKRVDAAMERAIAVLEHEVARLDAAGWLLLADLRGRRALRLFWRAQETACDSCPGPVFDGAAALAAYAEVERRARGGELASIARYYVADLLGQSPARAAQARSRAMLRAVVASRVPAELRLSALIQLADAAIEAERWSEAADLSSRALTFRSPSRDREFMTLLRVFALHRAGRSAAVLADVSSAEPWFPPGHDRDEMLDLAAVAIDLLGPAAPEAARVRFGPRLDELRRQEGAGDADVDRVAGAVVARCFRIAGLSCEHSPLDVESCRSVTLEGSLSGRGDLTTRSVGEGGESPAERRFRACLDGPQPALYGSGLPRPLRFLRRVQVRQQK